MKAFVTGATGLLGSNLTRALVEKGYGVRALVRSREKAEKQLGGLPNVKIVLGDIASVEAFAGELAGCDVLFHTAAYFREYFAQGNADNIVDRLNVEATVKLFAEADKHGVRRGIFTSSSGTVGRKPDGSAGDESTPPAPIAYENVYFHSKVKAEAALNELSPKLKGLGIIHILPGWMFGPGDAAPTGAGKLTLDFLSRRLPGVPPGGTETADARDVANAMIMAAEKGRAGARYIVGGKFCAMSELFAGLARASGVAAPKIPVPYPVALAFAWISETLAQLRGTETDLPVIAVKTMAAGLSCSSVCAARELGATFRPLDETLRDTVAWFRSKSDWAANAR